MSENRSRFRIKKGDLEVEYEGNSAEVGERYREVFEWIKTTKIAPPERKLPREKRKEKEGEKEEKRGGRRTAVISPSIDKLIEEGFFDDFKNSTQVLEELRRKTVPVSNVMPVTMALNRRIPKKLDRIKDEQGRWVYRRKQSDTEE